MTAKSNSKQLRQRRVLPLWWTDFALVLLICIAVFPVASRAQLGATSEEVGKVYGAVVRHNARIWHGVLYDTTSMDGDIYQKDGVLIRAAYHQNRVVLMEFIGGNHALTQKEVDEFLKASQGDSKWEMGKDSSENTKFYRRADGGAIAHWAIGEKGSLLVSEEKQVQPLSDKLLQ